jgi:FtsP/CotA-like multicopper oxidase with cupredoxin domain
MRFFTFAGSLAAVSVVSGALALGSGAGPAPAVERIDYGVTRTATSPAYAAEVAAPSKARVREFRIPITHDTIEIANGVKYEGWTFGGTVPGPTLRVREGDLVRVVLVNESPMPHSIDLHSARIPMNEAFRTIGPGEELRFEFVAEDPGAYMVHCGTPPVLMHIRSEEVEELRLHIEADMVRREIVDADAGGVADGVEDAVIEPPAAVGGSRFHPRIC